MESPRRKRPYRSELTRFAIVIGVIWALIIGASWWWNTTRIRGNTLEEARVEAKVAFEKDIVYRRWNTLHGGIYVRETPLTPPNPYLEHADRDVTTTSGMKLTLINPAYMTRQVYEIAGEDSHLRGHLTSTNPLRPGNAPDPWEKAALEAFEEGASEVSALSLLDGEEYMRLMRPLVTEEGCLACHSEQGYETGDIRGGLSVAVSMKPLRKIEEKNIITISLAHGLLLFLGLLGHIYGTGKLIRSEGFRQKADERIRESAAKLEESNRLKDLFIDIMRHDLINPVGVIKCYVSFLLEKETDPRKIDLCEKIDAVNTKLEEMIENASKYSQLEEMKEIERGSEDLNRILRESVDLALCPGDVSLLKVDYLPVGEYPASVNPMIGDVFTNLMSNIVKYASSGGKVEIGIDDDGDNWRVYLKDFGPGIRDEDKEKIFTRFERLEKAGVQGTGLGLAIAHRLVNLHGGRIWVEDNPEGGSLFYVSLRKAPPYSEAEATRP